MYAVIKTGGKQYRVAAGDKIQIEKLEGNPGNQMKFAEVLMIANGDAINIGAPHVAGATVVGEITCRTPSALSPWKGTTSRLATLSVFLTLGDGATARLCSVDAAVRPPVSGELRVEVGESDRAPLSVPLPPLTDRERMASATFWVRRVEAAVSRGFTTWLGTTQRAPRTSGFSA